ncbi:MAG TPA: nitroreductase family protein, partial [Spirochaetota bacterium]|nr:nitroreductase family protein [Spirochaetota bacterium]
MDIYQLITQRKSVRSYKEQPVPAAVLERVLEAGRMAPSAKNLQEWRFVVVQQAKQRGLLAEAANGQRFVGQAPVVIACCAVTDGHVMSCGQQCYPIDVAIAVDHLTLAAAAEGLGTCWIGAFQEE